MKNNSNKIRSSFWMNALCILYYLCFFFVFMGLNSLLGWAESVSAHTYQIQLAIFITTAVWLLGGGYLWLNRLLCPHPVVQIACKAGVCLLLLFGCMMTLATGSLTLLRLFSRVKIAVFLSCGYFFFSLIYDVVKLIRSRRRES